MFYRTAMMFLAAACLLLGGCYDSPFPLGASDASRIDERLLNAWIEDGASDDGPYRAVICKFNDKEYFVSFSNDNSSAVLARAYSTVIDGVTVLNMQSIESPEQKERTFVFFKYLFKPDGSLQTWMISDSSPLMKDKKFASQEAFAAYVRKHIHNAHLFGYMKRFKPCGKLGLMLSR